jgi:hypothetical protein
MSDQQPEADQRRDKLFAAALEQPPQPRPKLESGKESVVIVGVNSP